MSDPKITPAPAIGPNAHYVQYQDSQKNGGGTAQVINSGTGNRDDHLTIHGNGVTHFGGNWVNPWNNQVTNTIGNFLGNNPPNFLPPPPFKLP